MRAFVAVTDGDWYQYLAARPELTEVNFWRPGGHGRFRALAIGEPFFFKTHHPHNRVVAGFDRLPAVVADAAAHLVEVGDAVRRAEDFPRLGDR